MNAFDQHDEALLDELIKLEKMNEDFGFEVDDNSDEIGDGFGPESVNSSNNDDGGLVMVEDWQTGGQRRLTFEQVFELLEASEHGRMGRLVPVRPQASPINTDIRCFFVDPQAGSNMSDTERQNVLGPTEKLVCVKYQSFGNGEVWWSEKHGYRKGVVARNMSRRVRTQKQGQDDDHGFSGRWYNLLARDDPNSPVTRATCRSFVVPNVPSLVQFWIANSEYKRKKRKRGNGDQAINFEHSPSTSSSSASQLKESAFIPSALPVASEAKMYPTTPETESLHSDRTPFCESGKNGLLQLIGNSNGENGFVLIRGGLKVENDAVFYGNLSVRNLHVVGSLTVEQGINGQLVTPPEAADYAEWFEKLDPSEKIEAGDVVQLRSPDQKITKDTSGTGPNLVVSTTPSVAAGVPMGSSSQGNLCGFLGQVPVKCHGPVECGDVLVPSCKNDGYAIIGKTFHAGSSEPLATAMESCGEGKHVVLSFVRWAHSTKWSDLREKDRMNSAQIERVWLKTSAHLLFHISKGILLTSGLYAPAIISANVMTGLIWVEFLLGIWAMLHFPDYVEFRWEGKYFIGYEVFKGCFCLALLLIMFEKGEEDLHDRGLTKAEVRKLLIDSFYLMFEIYSAYLAGNLFHDTVQAINMDAETLENFETDFQRRKRKLKKKLGFSVEKRNDSKFTEACASKEIGKMLPRTSESVEFVDHLLGTKKDD